MTTTAKLKSRGGSVHSASSTVFLVESRLTGTTLGVRIMGDLDLATVEELEDLLSAYDGRARHYFFFLDEVGFVDVVGWKPIGSRCANGGGRVISASPSVWRIIDLLETTQLHRACW